MSNIPRPLVAVYALIAVATLAALLLLAGCTPREGGKCTTGSYSTHTENGKTTNLKCINGKWRKV